MQQVVLGAKVRALLGILVPLLKAAPPGVLSDGDEAIKSVLYRK